MSVDDRRRREPDGLRPAQRNHSPRLGSEQVHEYRQGQCGNGRAEGDLSAAAGNQWLAADDRGRSCLLRRLKPARARARRRRRQGAVANRRRRHGDDEHRDLFREQQAICDDVHRRRPVRDRQCAGAHHQGHAAAGARRQRDLRLRATLNYGRRATALSKRSLTGCMASFLVLFIPPTHSAMPLASTKHPVITGASFSAAGGAMMEQRAPAMLWRSSVQPWAFISLASLSRSAKAASRCAPCSAGTALSVTTSMPASGHMQLAIVSPFEGPSGIMKLFSFEAPGWAPSALEISFAVESVQARTWLGAA